MRRLEEDIAQYVIELENGPGNVSSFQVREKLLKLLRFPFEGEPEPTAMETDRKLNDPLGLWGRAPGWRCWVGRHGECEPLGADESCTCSCGIGGHGHDMDGVFTEGCDCGHEGLGERWHARDCAWRSTWPQRIREAAEGAGEDEG